MARVAAVACNWGGDATRIRPDPAIQMQGASRTHQPDKNEQRGASRRTLLHGLQAPSATQSVACQSIFQKGNKIGGQSFVDRKNHIATVPITILISTWTAHAGVSTVPSVVEKKSSVRLVTIRPYPVSDLYGTYNIMRSASPRSDILLSCR